MLAELHIVLSREGKKEGGKKVEEEEEKKVDADVEKEKKEEETGQRVRKGGQARQIKAGRRK